MKLFTGALCLCLAKRLVFIVWRRWWFFHSLIFRLYKIVMKLLFDHLIVIIMIVSMFDGFFSKFNLDIILFPMGSYHAIIVVILVQINQEFRFLFSEIDFNMTLLVYLVNLLEIGGWIILFEMPPLVFEVDW